MSCGEAIGDPIEVHQGDLLPIVEVAVTYQCNRQPFDFTGWTGITFTLEGPTTITGPATGDSNGVLTFVWGAGTTDVPGSYEGRFRGTSPDGKPRTFPTSGYIPVEIVA